MKASQPARRDTRIARLVLLAASCIMASAAPAAPVASAAPTPGALPTQHWVASWGTALQVPEPAHALPPEHWRDASLRQIVHLSLGGERLRVRISNLFGTGPLLISGASVGLALAPGRPDLRPQSVRALSFSGKPTVAIPPGATYYSDDLAMPLAAGADLAVSLHFGGEPARQTGHPGARAHSYIVKGKQLLAENWPDAVRIAHWYALSDVEVLAPGSAGAVVAIGDSITDGYGVTADSNQRWTDALAERLRQHSLPLAVVNAGIGGGRMLRDGLGPNLSARFERDVLARAGVTHAVVLIGVNDMGGQHRNTQDLPAERQQLLEELKMAHRQLVQRAHARGVCVIGGTLTPYGGSDYYHPGPENEADRQALNAWMRDAGVFDAVADFDAALRDPQQPARLKQEFDSGDGLHPSPAGYRAIAAAVPLEALQRRCD